MNTFDNIIEELIKFRDERNWKQFHTPENLAKSIVIEAGELLECFQWNSTNAKLKDVKYIRDCVDGNTVDNKQSSRP